MEAGHQIYIAPNKLAKVVDSKDDRGIWKLRLQADTGPALWVHMRPDANVLVANGRKVKVP